MHLEWSSIAQEFEISQGSHYFVELFAKVPTSQKERLEIHFE